MKTFLTQLSSSILFLSIPLAVCAKPVAQVVELSGTVIKVTKDGKTSSLRMSEHLEDSTELLVEEGASVKLNDFYDSTYHLAGGTQLKFFDKTVQLKKGKTWIQSTNTRHSLAITTANGLAQFKKSEFIASYDQRTSRSQFLVMAGSVDVANILKKDLKYSVDAGTFTTVDPEKESGLPRIPTLVGEASLNSAIAEFKSIPSNSLDVAPSRSIASVQDALPAKKGEILFISSVKRSPASVAPRAVLKKHDHSQVIPIGFYGINQVEPTGITFDRNPASISSLSPMIESKAQESIINENIEVQSNLKTKPVEHYNYSKELESLVRDLKDS